MLQEVKMYTVVCDNCGKDSNEDEEYSCYGDAIGAEEIAMENGYIKIGTSHFCDECWSYDENDKVIIDGTRRKA